MTKTVNVTSVTFLENVNVDASVYMVTFSDNTSAHLMCEPNTAESYLNQTVEVSFRKDIFKGEVVDFVDAIAVEKVVNLIDRTNNFKLYCEAEDTGATIAFKDIEQGETYQNCILYCTKTVYDSSARADWLDMTCSDRMRRVAHIKMFSPVSSDISFAGSYIKCDLRKNKYGFTTQEIERMDKYQAANPEIDIAEQFIKEQFKDDAAFMNFMDQSNILAFMHEYVGYELGSLLIDSAVCISIANEIVNIVPNLNVKALRQSFIVDKLWCTMPKSKYSKEFRTTYNFVKYAANIDSAVLGIVDHAGETAPDEYAVYLKVKALAYTILKTRKGDIDEA